MNRRAKFQEVSPKRSKYSATGELMIDGRTLAEFRAYLTETLIPDLVESGREFMADDLAVAVAFLDYQTGQTEGLREGVRAVAESIAFKLSDPKPRVSEALAQALVLARGEP